MNIIKKTYGLEDITSRIPGLFPYIEFSNNISVVHKATDSEEGCYGKIPTALTMPTGVFLDIETETINDNGETVTSTQHMIEENGTYSYRTLMILYYKYKDTYPSSTFIKFMKRGIGRFDITLVDVKNTTGDSVSPTEYDSWVLVPECEYLANAARLYNEYTVISIMCHKYNEIKSITGEINCDLECLQEKYAKMGGDTMKKYYQQKAVSSEDVAAEFFGYHADTETIDFTFNMVSSSHDMGILNTFLVFYDPRKDYAIGETVIYNDSSYKCVEEGTQDAEQLPGNAAWFVKLEETYSVESGQDKLHGTTDSKLRGFRNNKNYLDEGGAILYPGVNADWLWYYQVGDVGYSETITDEFNNVVIMDGYPRVTTQDEYEMHLMAYGDVITGITRDKINRTITFNYVIGAHLKAKYIGNETDDDGNVHHYIGYYEYDDSDTAHGVAYEEVYTYDAGGEIDNMEDDDQFNDYITYNQRRVGDTYKKCEFSTHVQTVYSQMTVDGVDVDYSYINSNFSANITLDKDSLVNPTFKVDYLDGISYKPEVKNDVRVTRGNAAAWERHLKLGEIRTFDDLATYANGGFFNLM